MAARPPVFTRSPATTRAVRGCLRNGSAAAAIVEPASICVVSADRAGRRNVRRYAIGEVLAVEEHRMTGATELTIITMHRTVSIVNVEVAQAWAFCRELRHLILSGPLAIES